MVPFEGAEKKCEIIVRTGVDLRSMPHAFWERIVDACEAEILSVIRNPHCDAYLLSESSLFVWSHRLLLITCGRTRLVRAVHQLLDVLEPTTIEHLLFQRKNEYFSHLQHSSFEQDVDTLQPRVTGRKLLLGSPHSHYTQLFHMASGHRTRPAGRTFELLLYGLGQDATVALTRPDLCAGAVRAFLQFERMMSGAMVDDFLFHPFGYSLNAIRGSDYLTVHITPDRAGSYVSLETNLELTTFVALPLALFCPRAFDLLLFNANDAHALLAEIPEHYAVARRQSDRLSTGDSVDFIHLTRTLPP